jgi:acyl-[acyl-carrier-protein] desaturase
MSSSDVLRELAPTAQALIERHLGNAKEWFPHEYVPWSRGRDFEPGVEWSPTEAPMDEAVRSSLFVNLLTEDNLPHYFNTIDHTFGGGEPWRTWSHRWTAEEGRHSIVIRDYLTVTRSVDPIALERGRMSQLCSGQVPQPATPADALVYVSLQEMATSIAHRNTGRLMTDEIGRKVMARVAGDETLHHVFYRDLTSALLELDPSMVVLAIDRNVREFAMPGTGIPGFVEHAKAIATAGIYDFAAHHDLILEPIVQQAWGLESVSGLSDEAEVARASCLKHISKVRRVARRQAERLAERREAAAAVA